MKRLRASLTAKVIAIFLLVILASTFALSTLASVVMYNYGFYLNNDYTKTSLCQSTMRGYIDALESDIIDYYDNWESTAQYDDSGQLINQENISFDYISAIYSNDDGNTPNLLFILSDSDNNPILANTTDLTDINTGELAFTANNGMTFKLNYSLAEELLNDDDLRSGYIYFNMFNPYKWMILLVSILTFILSGLDFVFLICAAGHRDAGSEVVLNFQDRIPLEIYLAGAAMGSFLCLMTVESFYYEYMSWNFILFSLPALIIIGLIVLALCMTVAARIKAGTLFRNTLAYRILISIWDFITNIKLLGQVILIFSVYAFFILFFYNYWILTTFIFVSFLFFVMARAVIQLDKLFAGGRKLAEGDMNYKIDTRRMRWKYKEHASNLNHIRLGMSKAVENEMKSERMKTELITNVSHDIKTPLTSIINYVDLLKKEDLDNKTALEYIEVLDRQSKRLKKMTEDLVEASKASTGNIPVNFERMNIVELLHQAIGEYEEIFAGKGLTPVINSNSDEIYISADGKLLWRVFDNLFTNVSKYAQPDTRVYIDVIKQSGKVCVAIKNISGDPLNITADELMERFVRGDVARTTEGSGLGLSITRSLAELQKAKFALVIDGDLFKAEICFDEIA
ncbi:MAG: HAMP domain-containing sensor histidine kinase [Erysipelotrichaceae bacterium]|nr:HAMP domain-containing sensor histidine kinase [Erysipelotrichaceae bacterium]